MTKIKQDFQFTYQLKHKVVRDLRIVTDHVGDLLVQGTAYFNPDTSVIDVNDRYSFDIDFIRWNGTDIKPVLEVVGGLEEIEEEVHRMVAGLFNDKTVAA